MIQYIEGKDIFESAADALVNPVNCMGTMGKGLAREFKKRFPECFPPYKQACDSGKLAPGVLQLVRVEVQPDLFGFRRPAIIHFPTKADWKGGSKLEWIEQGLAFLRRHYGAWGIKSVAIPQLGTGLGRLNWADVKPLIERNFADESLAVEVYIDILRRHGEFGDNRRPHYGKRGGPSPDRSKGENRPPR